ncbi:MAG: hypothetical protein ABIG66_03410 [Candidatus Kerfeldbacteria bacterium]
MTESNTGEMMHGMTWGKLIVKFVVMGIFIIGGIFVYKSVVVQPMLPDGLSSDAKKAVFLNDGQVYFGEIKEVNSEFILIQNPYYLQTATVLQGTTNDEDKQKLKKQLQVVPLGSEGMQLHGPERAMYVRWDAIKYIENMTESSEVLQIINSDPALTE